MHAVFSPLVTLETVSTCIDRILTFVKREENQLFIMKCEYLWKHWPALMVRSIFYLIAAVRVIFVVLELNYFSTSSLSLSLVMCKIFEVFIYFRGKWICMSVLVLDG